MKHFLIVKFFIPTILLLILFCFKAFSQKTPAKIELIQADVLEFNKSVNENARRFKGNVIFKHENAYLYCDSAFLYININSVDAFGHVHIKVNDSINAYGDVLNYNGNTKIAILNKNTRLDDNQIHLTADHLIYNLDNNVAEYNTGAKIIRSENILTSKIGYYYESKKEFFFKENVVLTNPNYIIRSDTLKYNTATEVAYFLGPSIIEQKENFIYCENGWYNTKKDIAQFKQHAFLTNRKQKLSGDSLSYNRKKRLGKAFSKIVLLDTIRDVIVKGNYGEYYEETDNSLTTNQAVFEMIDKENKDTLFLHADTLKTISDSSKKNKTMFAYHKAKFFKKNLQGLSDSIVYTYQDSMVTLYHNPILWSKENQMRAELIKIQISNNKVDKIYFFNTCFVASQYDTLRYNQIKGREMTAYFKDNEIYKLFVHGNAETIYYICENDSSMIGVNKSASSNLMLCYIWKKIRSTKLIC